MAQRLWIWLLKICGNAQADELCSIGLPAAITKLFERILSGFS